MFTFNHDLETREAGMLDVYKALREGKLEAVVVDVRPRNEYEKYHLPDAVSVPMDELFTHVEAIRNWSEDVPVVVHCAHGVNSGVAVLLLKAQGIDNLIHVADGIAPLLDKEID